MVFFYVIAKIELIKTIIEIIETFLRTCMLLKLFAERKSISMVVQIRRWELFLQKISMASRLFDILEYILLGLK